jgi:deoxycytidylate deaminase
MGRSTLGHSVVVTMFPCSLCCAALINSGITKVYSPAPDFSHVKYGEDMKLSLAMFAECGIIVEQFRNAPCSV